MACYDALMLATMTIVMLVVMLLMTRMIDFDAGDDGGPMMAVSLATPVSMPASYVVILIAFDFVILVADSFCWFEVPSGSWQHLDLGLCRA